MKNTIGLFLCALVLATWPGGPLVGSAGAQQFTGLAPAAVESDALVPGLGGHRSLGRLRTGEAIDST